MLTRSVPDSGTLQRSTFTIVSGYIFHIGLFVPFSCLHRISCCSMRSLVSAGRRCQHRSLMPRRRDHHCAAGGADTPPEGPGDAFPVGLSDYLVWLVTFLPLLTGYLAFHRIGLSPPMLIALHILSVELLMVLFPFTKLMHAFTLFMARYYNGAIAGYKGVHS